MYFKYNIRTYSYWKSFSIFLYWVAIMVASYFKQIKYVRNIDMEVNW